MEVNLTKRVLTPEGRRFCPVVISPNGRVKPDWVEINGQAVRHPEGSYYLDWTEAGRRQRVMVGSDATAALNSLRRKQSEMDALAEGLIVTDPKAPEEDIWLMFRLSAGYSVPASHRMDEEG